MFFTDGITGLMGTLSKCVAPVCSPVSRARVQPWPQRHVGRSRRGFTCRLRLKLPDDSRVSGSDISAHTAQQQAPRSLTTAELGQRSAAEGREAGRTGAHAAERQKVFIKDTEVEGDKVMPVGVFVIPANPSSRCFISIPEESKNAYLSFAHSPLSPPPPYLPPSSISAPVTVDGLYGDAPHLLTGLRSAPIAPLTSLSAQTQVHAADSILELQQSQALARRGLLTKKTLISRNGLGEQLHIDREVTLVHTCELPAARECVSEDSEHVTAPSGHSQMSLLGVNVSSSSPTSFPRPRRGSSASGDIIRREESFDSKSEAARRLLSPRVRRAEEPGEAHAGRLKCSPLPEVRFRPEEICHPVPPF
ncbi:unnamed protein product [Pleuronectes platessa]|uniref:Uncharacterized protein n=1 Tax=Pleuronectes platessa TaxID=8262 RepID=A0A9N7YKI5_PLEPL|nr:unnamed protein product [Pleuronectes platessa]